MTRAYVVTAALVQAHCVDDKDRHFYASQPIPEGVVRPDHLKYLVESGMVEQRDVAAAPEPDQDEWSGPNDATVDEVLAYVGDNPDRAAAVLDEEQAGKNRSTLVEKLQRLADPAQD